MNMKTALRCSLTALVLGLLCTVCSAQADRKEVRAGNRLFNKEKWQEADIEYRKATAKDSLSFAAWYNLAGAQYREGAFDEAAKSLEKIKDAAPVSASAADYYYNLGNIAVQKKDWKAAVDAYKQSLLIDPEDMDAKENYSYARQMLKNEGGGGGGQNNQNNQNDQNQNNDQNQDQNGQNQDDSQDQNNQGDNNDQNQDRNQDRNQGQNNPDQNKGDGQGEGQAEAKLSPQQAQGMLKAIQAREKETQDKVNKEKAALLKSRQKEKNW